MIPAIKYILLLVLISCHWPMQAQDREDCTVALLQSHLVWGDVEGNLSAFGQRVRACEGSDMIVLPELFTVGCEMKKGDPEQKIANKDRVAALYPQILDTMKQWAAKSQALIMGSTIYKEDGKYYNRLLAVYPDGSHRYYDKHNCFKKGGYSPGNEQLVLEWKGYRFATYICYDLRFPEWSRNDGRYDYAVYIANWPASRRDDWNRLLRERALENKAGIIAVNCVGSDPEGLMYAGDSVILSPDGEQLGACKEYQEEVLMFKFGSLGSPPSFNLPQL